MLDAVMPGELLQATGARPEAAPVRRMDFQEWETSGAAVTYKARMEKETERIMQTGKGVMDMVADGRQTSRRTADKLVGRTLGKLKRERFNSKEVQSLLWQLKQLKASIRETESGNVAATE